VRFKDPKPGVNLDRVATHAAAKKKLRDLAWLIKNGKTDVLERGILVPGRVGVGKSFLVDCFAPCVTLKRRALDVHVELAEQEVLRLVDVEKLGEPFQEQRRDVLRGEANFDFADGLDAR